jgi:uncharacterized protein
MPGGFLTLIWVVLLIGFAWSAAVVVFMALGLLRPRRMSDARALIILRRLSPSDLGLEFEDISFQIRDEQTGGKLNIAAWWIPLAEAGGKCAIVVHGYSDAKVGGIAWAPLLRSLGYSVLAIDLRAHGESGGKNCTAGYWERHDLNQVIDQFKASHPVQAKQIILFGVSLGAAVCAAAAVGRDDLAAVILECPFGDYQSAASRHGNNLGTPGRMFQLPAFKIAQWIAGCDFSAVRPADLIPKIPCPVMVIQSGDDPYLSEADRAVVKAAVQSRGAERGPSLCLELPGVHHVVGLRADPEGYGRKVEEFLDSASLARKTN